MKRLCFLLAGLFAAVSKFFAEFAIEKNNCLANRQAHLGAAETKHVDSGAPGQVGGA